MLNTCVVSISGIIIGLASGRYKRPFATTFYHSFVSIGLKTGTNKYEEHDLTVENLRAVHPNCFVPLFFR